MNSLPGQFLLGKRVAITGAGRGLGRALAIVTADFGADVLLLGRNPEKLNEVAETIRNRSATSALVVPCDLANPHSIVVACETVLSENAIVDVLINNGAPWLEGKLDELDDIEITSTISAAVSGTILVTRGLLPGLRRSTTADIVTIVSTAGLIGWDVNGASVPFHAAKHGQSGFNDRLRLELKEHNIRVSALYPPDFDDMDPLDSEWDNYQKHKIDGNLTNREIVTAIMFIIGAPRNCSFPVVVLDNM